MVSTLSTPRSEADAAALGAFRDWLATDLLARAVRHALVVSALRADQGPLLGVHTSVTMLRRWPPDGGSPVLELGFADESFEAVYLHRMIRVEAPAPWLGTIRRVLTSGGTILAAADPADFTFAPLPTGGDAFLLGRALRAAQFCRTELVCRGPRLVVVAARRDDPDPSY
jgi:hypothetical protein